MTSKGWIIVATIAGGAGSAVLAVLAVHTYLRTDYRGEGASAEQARECCDRIKKLEDEEHEHVQDAQAWKQRIIDNEKTNEWQARRLDASDVDRTEIREMLGEIRGQLNELLKRTSKGPVNPSSLKIGAFTPPLEWRYPARPRRTDSVEELLDGLQGGGP